MVAANFRRTHSPSRLAWSEGWRPPDAQSTFTKWTEWTLAMTLVMMTAPQTLSWLLLFIYSMEECMILKGLNADLFHWVVDFCCVDFTRPLEFRFHTCYFSTTRNAMLLLCLNSVCLFVSKSFILCGSSACWIHVITRTHPFNGPFSRTTQVRRYQKGKTCLDFTEALFFTGRMPFLPPNQQCQSTEGIFTRLQ